MKFCAATDHFYPGIMGGSGRIAYELATLLAREGHELTIITRQWDPGLPAVERRDGLLIRRFGVDLSGPVKFARSAAAAGGALFRDVYSGSAPDAVLLFQPVSSQGLLDIIRTRKLPAYYFFYAPWKHEFISGRPSGGPRNLKNSVRRLFLQGMERNAVSACRKVFVFSRFSEDQLRRGYALKRQEVVRSATGVNLERFTPGSMSESRARLGLPDGPRILFTVRALEPGLGLEELLTAFKRLHDDDPEMRLLIAGKGPLEESLYTLIRKFGLEDRVRLTGYIPERELPDYYRAADLFVLPATDPNAFGLQIAEAIACGTPAVGTPTGSIPEILYGLDPRLLAASTAAEALEATLHNFFRIRRSREEWNRLCRAHAEYHFSWNRLRDDFLAQLPQLGKSQSLT